MYQNITKYILVCNVYSRRLTVILPLIGSFRFALYIVAVCAVRVHALASIKRVCDLELWAMGV